MNTAAQLLVTDTLKCFKINAHRGDVVLQHLSQF